LRILDLFVDQEWICKIKKLEFDWDKAIKQIEKLKREKLFLS
jgi:hypothetical protein